MGRTKKADAAGVPALRLDGQALLRAAAGFAAGLAVWLAFAAPYERTVAAAANAALRLFESPAVTEISATLGEFHVDRADFPADAPRPGVAADDLHFNFVLLCALFALRRHPLSAENFGRFWIAAGLLWVIHVAALIFQVESIYALHLGPWSAAHYGAFARNFWAAGFHFYQIAGRFAAPFALWWGLSLAGLVRAAGSGSRGSRTP